MKHDLIPCNHFTNYLEFESAFDEKYPHFLDCLEAKFQIRDNAKQLNTEHLGQLLSLSFSSILHEEISKVVDDEQRFGAVLRSACATMAAQIHELQRFENLNSWFFHFAFQLVSRSALLSEVRFALNNIIGSDELNQVMNLGAQVTTSTMLNVQEYLCESLIAFRNDVPPPSQVCVYNYAVNAINNHVRNISEVDASRIARKALKAADNFCITHRHYKFFDRDRNKRCLPSEFLSHFAAIEFRHVILFEVEQYLAGEKGDALLAA